MDLEKDVGKGIKIMLDNGVKGSQMTFYILMGFDTTLEEDKYRALKIHEWGAVPYAQLYNRTGSPELRTFVREVNRKHIWYSLHPRPKR